MNNCHICKSDKLNKIEFPKNFKFILSNSLPTPNTKEIFFCKECKLSVTNINKEFLNHIYTNYKNYNQKRYLQDSLQFNTNTLIKRSTLITDYLGKFINLKNKYSLLEIGASSGSLLYELSKQSQMQLNAFDLDENYKKEIKTIKNFNKFYTKDIQNIHDKFDIIILTHVIEHIVSPRTFLNNLKEILSGKKIIFFQLPDIIYNPFDYIIYDHVTNFSLKSFKHLMCDLGFEIINISNLIIKGQISCIVKHNKKIKKSINKSEYSTYKSNSKKVIRFFKFVQNLKNSKNLIIYGAGNLGSWLSSIIKDWNGYFFDDDKEKQKQKFLKKKVFKPDFKNNFVLIPFQKDSVSRILKQYGINKKKKNIIFYEEKN